MRIAVLSDSHDNIPKFDAALELASQADAFIHCGDLCSPFMAKRLAQAADGRPVHVVWGNNDGDPVLISRVTADHPAFHLHGQLAEVNLAGVRIGVNHYPEIARPLAASGFYDLVCYGHDHQAHCSQVGNCVLLNPGELLGLMGKTSFAWFDCQSRKANFVDVI